MNLSYGVIGNCRTVALIDKKASIVWSCFPRFDSPSVFAKLLDDEKGGSFEFISSGKYQVRQQYFPHTNVLTTTFSNSRHIFVVVDFFECYMDNGKLVNDNRIYRLVRVVKGKPKVKVLFDPKMNYALADTKISIKDNAVRATENGDFFTLQSNIDLNKAMAGEEMTLDSNKFFILSYNEERIDLTPDDIEEKLSRTMQYWQKFVSHAVWPKNYRREVIRSALILKLLTYEKTGAIVAAATTSLPEIVGEERNWDYRFCWLRDSSFTVNAFTRLCRFKETKAFMTFLKSILLKETETGGHALNLQIMYGVEGEKELVEKVLSHLKGFMNSSPVRIGNAAYNQEQIDVAGEVIDSIYEYYVYYNYHEGLEKEMWDLVLQLAYYVVDNWRKKDQGIWEFREIKEHFTFSKLMSWVAIDRTIKIAQAHSLECDLDEFRKIRDEIREEICEKAWNDEKKAFTMFYGSSSLDASVLLMPYYDFINAKDQRMKETIKAIERELVKDECLVLRYNMEDDFGEQKNSFSICSFWYIDALYLSGQRNKARRLFRKFLNYSNHLGLFSEDVHIDSKKLVGNYPQAYTHLALIYTAILLSGKGSRRPVCDIDEFKTLMGEE